MIFKLSGPLGRMAGEELDVELDKPTPLKDLLGTLSTRMGALIPYGEKTTEAQLMANLSFFRGNKLIRLEDLIGVEDIILVLLPATGG